MNCNPYPIDKADSKDISLQILSTKRYLFNVNYAFADTEYYENSRSSLSLTLSLHTEMPNYARIARVNLFVCSSSSRSRRDFKKKRRATISQVPTLSPGSFVKKFSRGDASRGCQLKRIRGVEKRRDLQKLAFTHDEQAAARTAHKSETLTNKASKMDVDCRRK